MTENGSPSVKCHLFCGDGNLGHLAGLIEHHAGDRHREALRLKTLSEHVCCALFASDADTKHRAVPAGEARNERHLHPLLDAGVEYLEETGGGLFHGRLLGLHRGYKIACLRASGRVLDNLDGTGARQGFSVRACPAVSKNGEDKANDQRYKGSQVVDALQAVSPRLALGRAGPKYANASGV